MIVIKIVFLRKREYTEKASKSGNHVGKLQEACSRALSTKIQEVSHSFIQNTSGSAKHWGFVGNVNQP